MEVPFCWDIHWEHWGLNPANDTFLSSSQDQMVCLWTAQSASCLKELKVPGGSAVDWNTNNSAYSDGPVSPLATFDSTGLVFAVTAPMVANSTAATAAGGGGQHLHLYDAQNYTSGALMEWQVHMWSMLEQCMPQHIHVTLEQASQLARAPWTSLQFNVLGNQHLVSTAADCALCWMDLKAPFNTSFPVPHNVPWRCVLWPMIKPYYWWGMIMGVSWHGVWKLYYSEAILMTVRQITIVRYALQYYRQTHITR